MIRPIHPVQDFNSSSKAKKVASITAGAIAATGVALTIAAAVKGKKSHPDEKLLSKISEGYKEMYEVARKFSTDKGALLKEKSQTAFDTAKTFVTEKGGKLKEQASSFLTTLRDKLPKKAEKVAETVTETAEKAAEAAQEVVEKA